MDVSYVPVSLSGVGSTKDMVGVDPTMGIDMVKKTKNSKKAKKNRFIFLFSWQIEEHKETSSIK